MNDKTFDEIVDYTAERIKKEPERVVQDILFEVSEAYDIDIKQLAAALGKRKKRRKGMKVECEIEQYEKEDDAGRMRMCTTATCGRCGHETESWGDGENSIKRCLVLMREECPEGETNFYVQEGS